MRGRNAVPLVVSVAAALAALVISLLTTAAVVVPVLLAVVVAVLLTQLPWRRRVMVPVADDAIARALRDDVLQNLAAVGYSLGAAERTLTADEHGLGPVMRRLGEIVRSDIHTLRHLLGDAQPPR